MNPVALIVGLGIAAIVAAYVAQPLLRKQRVAGAQAASPRERLEAEYHALLGAMRDLDFDFQTGKLLEEDYAALREQYAARGAALLKELDQLVPSPAVSDRIEAMVQARRKVLSPRRCPACGQPYQAQDRFCGKCGARLEVKA